MKRIEEARREYLNSFFANGSHCERQVLMAFEAGVKFAEEWGLIERYDNGLIVFEERVEMFSHTPFITLDNEGNIELFKELNSDIKTNRKYTHWRPVNHK